MSTLPLDGRNFIPLVTLSPGVALPGGESLLPRINGSRPRTNEYLYDGISVLQPEPGQVAFYPIIDGIAEFKLNVNSYSPEYGRSNGGTVMVIGKSGSNGLHGTLFEFFRNEDLNARNLFAQPGPKPDSGATSTASTLGGPDPAEQDLLLRGLAGHAAAHRHHALQRRSHRWRSAQGIFTRRPYSTPPPRRAHLFPGNTIPPPLRPHRRPGSAALSASELRRRQQLVRTATEPDNQDQSDFRLDRYFGDSTASSPAIPSCATTIIPSPPCPMAAAASPPGVIGHAITRGDALAGDYDWVLSPTALEPAARFGYSRRDLDQTSLQNGGIAVPGLPANSFASVLPIFTVAGFQQIGPTTAANSNFTTSITEFLDTFTAGARPPHHEARSRYPPRGAGRPQPAQSHRLVRLQHHRHQQLHGFRQRQCPGVAPARAGERLHHRHPEAG